QHHLYFLGYHDTSIFLSDVLYQLLSQIAATKESGIAQYDLLKKIKIDSRNITYYINKLVEAGLIKKFPILKNSWKLVLSLLCTDPTVSVGNSEDEVTLNYCEQFKHILEENRGKNVPQSVIRKELGLSGSANKKKFSSIGKFVSRKGIGVCYQARIKDGGRKVSTFWKLQEDNAEVMPSQIGMSQIGGIENVPQSQLSQLFQSQTQMSQSVVSQLEASQMAQGDSTQITEIAKENEDDESSGYMGKNKALLFDLYSLVRDTPEGVRIKDIATKLKMSVKLATRLTQFVSNTNLFGISVTMEGKLRSKTAEYRLWLKDTKKEPTPKKAKSKSTVINVKNSSSEEEFTEGDEKPKRVLKKSTTTLNKDRSNFINEYIKKNGVVALSEIRRELSEHERVVEHHKTIVRLLQPGIIKDVFETIELKIPLETGGFRATKVVVMKDLENKSEKIKEYIKKSSKVKPMVKKEVETVIEIDKESVKQEGKKAVVVKKYFHGQIKPLMIRVKTCFIELWEYIFKKGSPMVEYEGQPEMLFGNVQQCKEWLLTTNFKKIEIGLMDFVENLEVGMFNKLIGIAKDACPFDEEVIESGVLVKQLQEDHKRFILSNKVWIKRLNVIISVLRDMRLIERNLESNQSDGMVLVSVGTFFTQNTKTGEVKAYLTPFESNVLVNQFWVSVEMKSLQLPTVDPVTNTSNVVESIVIEGLQNLAILSKATFWQTGSTVLTKPQRAMIYHHIYNQDDSFDSEKLCSETGFSEQQLAYVINKFREKCAKRGQPVVDKKFKIRRYTIPIKKKKTKKVADKEWSKEEDRRILLAYRIYWFEKNVEQKEGDSLPDYLPEGILKKLTKKVNAKMKQIDQRLKELVGPDYQEFLEEVFGENVDDIDDIEDEVIEGRRKEKEMFVTDYSIDFTSVEERDAMYQTMALLRMPQEDVNKAGIDVIKKCEELKAPINQLFEGKFVNKDKNPLNPFSMAFTQKFLGMLESKKLPVSFFEKITSDKVKGWEVIQQSDLNSETIDKIMKICALREDFDMFIFPSEEKRSEEMGKSVVFFCETDTNNFLYEKGINWSSSLLYTEELGIFSKSQLGILETIKSVFEKLEEVPGKQSPTLNVFVEMFPTLANNKRDMSFVIAFLLYKGVIVRELTKQLFNTKVIQNNEENKSDVIYPWSKFDGTLDVELYNSLLHRVRCFVFRYPSISVENLCKEFPFSKEETLCLLQQLVDEGVIEIKANGLFEDGLYLFPKCDSFFE
ncbi:hypothetical protein EIN_179290, partial [Entamoeba invadens IP1]|uniref:hypothetical protein n=1 Tax=Entamoeba invadens IP1 TaxID=370355 RepID=UPI0002C3E7FF